MLTLFIAVSVEVTEADLDRLQQTMDIKYV